MLKSMKLNKQIALGGDEIVKDVGFSTAGINDLDSDESEKYPYQLRLTLDDEILDKLGVDQPPAFGASLDMIAKVKVIGVNQYEDGASICLQITDMLLGKPKEEKPSEQILYGSPT